MLLETLANSRRLSIKFYLSIVRFIRGQGLGLVTFSDSPRHFPPTDGRTNSGHSPKEGLSSQTLNCPTDCPSVRSSVRPFVRPGELKLSLKVTSPSPWPLILISTYSMETPTKKKKSSKALNHLAGTKGRQIGPFPPREPVFACRPARRGARAGGLGRPRQMAHRGGLVSGRALCRAERRAFTTRPGLRPGRRRPNQGWWSVTVLRPADREKSGLNEG